MIAFLMGFFLSYGGLHLWVLSRLRVLLKPHPLFLIPILFFYLGPLLTHWFLRWDNDDLGRLCYLVSFTWMAFLFLCGAFLLMAEGMKSLGILGQKRGVLGSVLLSLAVLTYGYFEALSPRLTVLEVRTHKVTRAYIIALLSDLHAGPVVRGTRLERLIRPLLEAPPDLVLSAGDLLDSEVKGGLEPLARLSPPLGKYAVLGNHEGYLGTHRAQEIIESLGFRVLKNEAVKVGEIVLVGVDDPHVRGPEAREREILLGAERGFRILLKHRPRVSPEAIGLFDLQLSGHTHGGQIFPFSLLVKAFYPLDGGLVPMGGGYLYTSRGTGTWGPPIRFLSPPEITIIRLTPLP